MLSGRRKDLWALTALLCFVAAVHHYVVFLGEQPVGGDKTAFFFGLMSHYGDGLKQGSLPFWNEHWGFGFPGVAESQVGAFYFPHLILYRLLAPIDAFRWNYVLHHFAVAVSAYLSFRWMRLRPLGAWLASMAYAGGGFATIHFDHQWAVESMTWLPPVVAATHRWRTHGSRCAWLALPWLVAVQLTIGHFQVAFITLTMAGMVAVFPGLRPAPTANPMRTWLSGVVGWASAVVLGFCLAGPQVATTFEFQRHIRAANPNVLDRDYLGNFALPPDRLVNLLWPLVYFREPLWREVIWDPFKTSPEECLNYIGLLPLFLALASGRFIRRRRVVGLIWTLALASTVLAFGPYSPVFGWITNLPGFGYFRSPARWTLAQEFALAWLAGWMLDRLVHRWQPIRRSGMAFALAWALTGLALAIGWRTWIVANVQPPAALRALTEWTMPTGWQNPIEEMQRQIRKPRSWSGMTARQWMSLGRADRPATFAEAFAETLRIEFLPTLLVGFAALILCLGAGRATRWRRALLATACVVDFVAFGWIWTDRSAPRSRLVPETAVVASTRQLCGGGRVLGPGGNFFMSVDAGPIRAYRTLDVPWNPAFFGFLDAVEAGNPQAISKLGEPPWSLFGVRTVVAQYVPLDRSRTLESPGAFEGVPLDLWLDGNDWVRRYLGSRTSKIAAVGPRDRPLHDLHILNDASPHSSVVSTTTAYPAEKVPAVVAGRDYVANRGAAVWGEPVFPWNPPQSGPIFSGLYNANPAIVGSARLKESMPSRRVFDVDSTAPAVVVVGELYLPGWHATIKTPDGQSKSADVGSCDAYWQALDLPNPGKCQLQLTYTPPGFRDGQALAGVGFGLWIIAALSSRPRHRFGKGRRSIG